MPLRRGDQIGGKVVSPYPVNVSDHPKGRKGLDPIRVDRNLPGLPKHTRQHRKDGSGQEESHSRQSTWRTRAKSTSDALHYCRASMPATVIYARPLEARQ